MLDYKITHFRITKRIQVLLVLVGFVFMTWSQILFGPEKRMQKEIPEYVIQQQCVTWLLDNNILPFLKSHPSFDPQRVYITMKVLPIERPDQKGDKFYEISFNLENIGRGNWQDYTGFFHYGDYIVLISDELPNKFGNQNNGTTLKLIWDENAWYPGVDDIPYLDFIYTIKISPNGKLSVLNKPTLSDCIVGTWQEVEKQEVSPDYGKPEKMTKGNQHLLNYRTDGIVEETVVKNGVKSVIKDIYEVDDSRRRISHPDRSYFVQCINHDTLIMHYHDKSSPESTNSIQYKVTFKLLK